MVTNKRMRPFHYRMKTWHFVQRLAHSTMSYRATLPFESKGNQAILWILCNVI